MQLRHIALALAIAAASLPAQSAPRTSGDTAVAAIHSTIGDPTAPGTRTVGPAILAAITSKDKVVSGAFGTTFGESEHGEWNPWIKASGSVDDNDATAPVILADLSGLRVASKVAAGINFVRWPWTSSATAQQAFCRSLFADSARAPDSIVKVINKTVVSAAPERRAAVRDSIVDYLATHRCSRIRLPAAERPNFDELVDYGRVYLVSVNGEYGSEAFKYADTLALRYKRIVTQPWAMSAGAGMYFPNRRVLVAGTLRYEQSDEGGVPRQYCVPVGNTAATQCRSVALGPPERDKLVLLTAETRWFFNERTGLSPRFTADLTGSNGVGVELPILLRQSTDKGFTSAFAIGWRSRLTNPDDNEHLYVSVTFGALYGVGLKR